ncbi:hypothetical protein TI03_04320, partial [Achromatium sp. WMS1]
ISWYQLTIEPNTIFFRKPPLLPDEDLIWMIQNQGEELLAANNFIQYEVSAYTHANNKCQHNLNYWHFGDYIGIGPGAHGKITKSNGQIFRTCKLTKPQTYLAAKTNTLLAMKPQMLTKRDLINEFILNALRLKEGFTLDLFEARTGVDKKCLTPELTKAASKGLIIFDGEKVRASTEGYRFLNTTLTFLFQQ